MKRFFKTISLLFLGTVFIISSGFAPSSDEAMVKIDGQVIEPEGVLKFERDDTVYLEATGIKPNSEVNIKIKKAGINWAKHNFRVDKKGEVIGIMHMPEQKLKVKCTVQYYDASNTFHEVEFKFQTY